MPQQRQPPQPLLSRPQKKQRKRRGRIPWFIVLLLICVLFAKLNYDTRSELGDMRMEKRQLEEENERVKGQVSELETDVSFLLFTNYAQEEQISLLEEEVLELNEENNKLISEGGEFKNWVILRGNLDPKENGKKFLTPNDEAVENKKNEILSTDADGDLSWNDMRTLDRWVYDNIEYNYDTPLAHPNFTGIDARAECWMFPNETLEFERGDCEDHTLLTLSMFFAEEEVGWAWAGAVEFEDGANHMLIFLNVDGDKLSIMDPTASWDDYSSDTEEEKIEEYGMFVGRDVVEIKFIFNLYTYKEFDSLSDFYEYF